MDIKLVNCIFLIVLVFAITLISLLTPFKEVVSQVDPSQEQIEPIPPLTTLIKLPQLEP